MAFNRMYRFKTKAAEYAFNLGIVMIGLSGIATLVMGVKTSIIGAVSFALLCLAFAYLMEKEMRKK